MNTPNLIFSIKGGEVAGMHFDGPTVPLSDQTPTRTRSTEANQPSYGYSEAIDLGDNTSALYWLLDQTCLLQRCREMSAVVGLPVEELDGAIAELNDMVADWEATHLPVVA